MPTSTINHLALAYDELGDPKNPALVLAHALAGDRSHFAGVAGDLAGDFHIINLDLHGHGDSQSPTSFSLERMADDCAALLESLDLPSVCWTGESMGAMIGMRLALSHPHRLGSLVLINSSPRSETEENKAIFLQLARDFRAGRTDEVFEAIAPLLFCDATRTKRPELVAQQRELFTRPRDREGIYQAALAVYERSDITRQLHTITVPTLVLTGAHDTTYPRSTAELIASEIRGARLQVIPDSSHMSATEQPQEVAGAIREFLTAALTS